MLDLFLRYADALVQDGNSQHEAVILNVLELYLRVDLDQSGLFRELGGIRKEIEKHLL